MKALCFSRFGGPEVLEWQEIADPVIGAGEILVRTKAIGLNFADIYRRKGNYHLQGQPPFIAGYEGAGIVEKVSSDISGVQVGDRVAFCDVPYANAELVAVPVDRAIPLPTDISFNTAAGLLLQGLTAHYLAHDSYKIVSGSQALIHAAAGGVGQLLVQICGILGGRAVGLTSSDAKRQVAIAAGAQQVWLYEENWSKLAAEWSNQGIDVVYDSVGSTLMDSFKAAKIGGTVVFYGMAGGDPEPVDPRMLMDTSKTLTGGDLWNILTSHHIRVERSNELFDWVRSGRLKLAEPALFPLSEGAEAHRYLESRQSTGKVLLIP
jgi:NADPH:quinone reductase